MSTTAEVNDLVLRVHTKLADDSAQKEYWKEHWRKKSKKHCVKWAKRALVVDCETTTQELGQRLNFGFYQKCELKNGSYQPIEEGVIVADDLERRLGKDAIELLEICAHNEKSSSVCGRFAKIRIYTRSEWIEKVFFPWAVLRKAAIVGANLAFDLSVLSIDYHDHKTENGFSSELASRYKGRENKRYPRLRDVPKNSRTAFLDLSGGTGPFKCGKRFRGRFLDVLTVGFAMRNAHFSLESACEEWKVEGKLDHTPKGKVTLDEIRYCREDVAATLRLLNAQRKEYETYPISLPPEKALSPASLAKSFKESMGLERPMFKFKKLPDRIHGIAMQAYYGGRSEVRIRDTVLPVTLLDYTSNYPASAALLNTWKLEIAKELKVKNCTKEARRILSQITQDKLLDKNFWPKLAFIAQVIPDGQPFPLRSYYADDGESTNIGFNPLFSKTSLWFAGPDLANAVLHGWKLKVVKAITLIPIGIQSGLKEIPLGNRTLDPAKEDPYIAWVEEKEVTKGEKRNFIKCLLNSGGYGLSVELNRKRFPARKPQKVRIWAGEQELPSITTTDYEEPGKWYFPWIGSLITAGGRLLLGILQKEVETRETSFLMTDTDSMAVMSTRRRGLFPCPGGPHKMPDGREAVKALSWADAAAITDRIQALSPFSDKIRFLKFDKTNFNSKAKRHQLFGLGYSAKRYCLRTEKEIIKPSEHGLGPYFVPAKDGERFWSPEDCMEDKKYLRWVKELWELKFGMRKELPEWTNYLSMRKYAVTSPNILKKLRALDKAAAKPHSFCISPIPAFGGGSKVAPLCDKPNQWPRLEYVDLESGEKSSLVHRVNEAAIEEGDGTSGDALDQTPHKLGEIAARYSESIEHKSLAPDGSKCAKDTKGLLRPRPIRASGTFHWIGKEVDRGSSLDPEFLSQEELKRYGKNGNNGFRFPEFFKKFSVRKAADWSGLPKSVISRAKNGQRIKPTNEQKLTRIAARCARISSKRT
jgi:hypothetical protein